MNIRDFIAAQVKSALDAVGAPTDSQPLVTQSTKPEFGDYQSNAAMPVAKKMGCNPRELAGRIIDALALDEVADKLEIAGPGFINIHLKPEWLARQCADALTSDSLNACPDRESQQVVVDYSGPNLAKEMHVGHLRSTIIGDAVVRVLEFAGDNVTRQNHMGDWGTQFGMLIAHLEDQLQDGESESVKLADLEAFYRQAKLRFDDEAGFADRARDYVVKLQAGDSHCRQLWQQFITVSIAHSEEIYSGLNVSLSHDDIRPESAYNDDLPGVIESLQEQGLAAEDQGAQVVFLDELADKEGNPSPVIVQKSDGGYLYATTDLAALSYRAQQLKADRVLYFVDARQSLHLQQMFITSKKAGFVPASVSLEHLAFGTMMGSDGRPFKTRSGDTVKLAELLDEAVERAEQLVAEKAPDLAAEERGEIARKVGIGAVKYADLSKNRTSDYIFNWDTMLSFEGNTAPYLQYAYTRIRSIFRKAGIEASQLDGALAISEPSERKLALKLVQFAEVIEQVANDCTPHMLCGYLYELAGEFMSFYEACPVLKDGVAADVKQSRLQLCGLTANTIQTGLDLLGIEVMERM